METQPMAQTCSIDDDPERQEFLDRLSSFLELRNESISRLPVLGKSPLDLFKLWQLIIERGGLVSVIKNRQFMEIVNGLNISDTKASVSFYLRQQYKKYLYAYECELYGFSTYDELEQSSRQMNGTDLNKEMPSNPNTSIYNNPLHPSLNSLAPSTLPCLNPLQNLAMQNSLDPSVASSMSSMNLLQNLGPQNLFAILQLMNTPGLTEAAAAFQSTNAINLLQMNMMNTFNPYHSAINQPVSLMNVNMENVSTSGNENDISRASMQKTSTDAYQPTNCMNEYKNTKHHSEGVIFSNTMDIDSREETLQINEKELNRLEIESIISNAICDNGDSRDANDLSSANVERNLERIRTPSNSSGNESPPSESCISPPNDCKSTPSSSTSQADSGIDLTSHLKTNIQTVKFGETDKLCSIEVYPFKHPLECEKNSLFLLMEVNGVSFEGYVNPANPILAAVDSQKLNLGTLVIVDTTDTADKADTAER